MSEKEPQQETIQLTVGPSRIESFLPLLGLEGWHVDGKGYLVDDEGIRVDSTCGEPLPLDDIGYIGYTEEGLDLVPDCFPAIVQYLTERELSGGKSNQKLE